MCEGQVVFNFSFRCHLITGITLLSEIYVLRNIMGIFNKNVRRGRAQRGRVLQPDFTSELKNITFYAHLRGQSNEIFCL
jgi:hypothetical protein